MTKPLTNEQRDVHLANLHSRARGELDDTEQGCLVMVDNALIFALRNLTRHQRRRKAEAEGTEA